MNQLLPTFRVPQIPSFKHQAEGGNFQEDDLEPCNRISWIEQMTILKLVTNMVLTSCKYVVSLFLRYHGSIEPPSLSRVREIHEGFIAPETRHSLRVPMWWKALLVAKRVLLAGV